MAFNDLRISANRVVTVVVVLAVSSLAISWLQAAALSDARPALPKWSGVVVDDSAAELTGEWVQSTKRPPLLGDCYRHDDNELRGQKSARFSVELPAAGQYEVRLIYTATENRATNATVVVQSADGEKTFAVDQRRNCMKDGVPRALGVCRFEASRAAQVTVSNEGANGYVIVDGVQFVPLGVAQAERAAASAEREAITGPIQIVKSAPPADVDGKQFDLVVIGGNPGGIACSIRAAREGSTVLLVQHTQHLGGMMTNGLTQWDALYGGHRAPLFSELLRNIEKYYRLTYGEQSRDFQAAKFTQSHYPLGMVEPHVAEREFNRLIAAEPQIAVLLEHYPVAVTRDGALLRDVTLRRYGGTKEIRVEAKTFVDATYEGDLAALAKVPYRVGREARDEFDEPHAGKVFANIARGPAPRDAVEGKLNIRPYSSQQGSVDPDSPFTADGAVQAYNFRFSVTCDPDNRILPDKPPNYRREEYVNYGRKYIGAYPGPNLKTHMNSPILPGENHEYPEADWPTREKIARRHLEFALGLVYFLQNDESVPPAQRAKFRQWGLPKDEYVDNEHVPYEMYVREARRIVGRHVYTEHDNSLAPGLDRTPVHPDSVAITDWYMDSHACTTDSRPGYKYDGKLILTEQSRPGQIPYRSLLPRGVDNLLVPVCLSATHIAWGAVRLEPVWMQTGEAAGFAAALAKRHNTTPAGLDPDLLLRTLVEHRMMVSFFNDVDVAGDQPWVPAVQYFGTKGCFDSYNAHADQPLTDSVARVWAETFGKLVAGQLDTQAQATALGQTDHSNSRPIPAEEFAKMLGQKLSDAGREAATAQAVVTQLAIPPQGKLSRGDACRIMYVLSQPRRD